MSNKVYLGPYLKVSRIDRDTPVKRVVDTCSNPKCLEHGKVSRSKFCPECGFEVKTIPIVEMRSLDIDDVISDTGIYEDFFSVVDLGDEGVAMGYNLRSHYCDSDYGDYERGINPEIIEKEIEAFRLKEEVAQVAEYLRERGVGCGVKWGVIVHSGY